MPKKRLLLKGFFKKEFIEYRRYIFESVGGMITLLIILLLILWGVKSVGGSVVKGDTVESFVVGYVLFMFFLGAYGSMSGTIRSECKDGTLEQLYMAAYPFRVVLVIKAITSMIIGLIITGVLLALTMLITRTGLNVDLVSIIPLSVITAMSFIGLGLMSGGLTLVFKKVDSFLQILQFAIIAFIAAPVDKIPILKLLPGSLGSNMINRVMVQGKSIFEFSLMELSMLLGVGILYIIIGAVIYKKCESKAMDLGILGQY